jgi:hypothetical protein
MIHTEAFGMSPHKNVKIHLHDEMMRRIPLDMLFYLFSSKMTNPPTFQNAETQDIQNSNFRDSFARVGVKRELSLWGTNINYKSFTIKCSGKYLTLENSPYIVNLRYLCYITGHFLIYAGHLVS